MKYLLFCYFFINTCYLFAQKDSITAFDENGKLYDSICSEYDKKTKEKNVFQFFGQGAKNGTLANIKMIPYSQSQR